jgi:plastocyanin
MDSPKGGNFMRKLFATMTVACICVALVAAGAMAGTTGTKQALVRDNWIAPHGVRIHQGSKVRWKWQNTENDHNVTCTRGCGRKRVRSRTKSGGSFTVTFKRPGDFRFVCTIHGGNMYTNVHVR